MLSQAAQTTIRTTISGSAIKLVPSIPPVAIGPLNRSAEPLAETMRLMGATMSYPRNGEIFGEDEPADFLYKVVSGCVRTYKILSDGRRQIGGFYLPGEIFGLEFGADYTLSAEAIADTKVLVIKRSALNGLAERDPAIGRELFSLTGREVRRVQNRILLLIESAQERVAGFLLEMADRVCTGNAIELPMSRQDIADYLGLTIETVSRTLTQLQAQRLIALSTCRKVRFLDREALEDLCQ